MDNMLGDEEPLINIKRKDYSNHYYQNINEYTVQRT